MRDLTPDEIKAAPDWATHYVTDDACLRWSDHSHFQWVGGHKMEHNNYFIIQPVPIPRKEFDISEHEFSEGGISVISVDVDDDRLTLCVGHSEGDFTKKDIAAMAKALKLTPEDLK